jgi:uncharacterized protein with HEPN domain
VTDPGDKARDAAERAIAMCDVLADLTRMDVDAFVDDVRTQWALEMGLIRIGETINRIPESILERFPGQPWRQIVGMRNFAGHQYDDLEPRRVWQTVTRHVPALRAYLTDVVLPGMPA